MRNRLERARAARAARASLEQKRTAMRDPDKREIIVAVTVPILIEAVALVLFLGVVALCAGLAVGII
jgi:hypothetical protein